MRSVVYTFGMPVTRDEVARRAGVSVATVSYVLNNGPRRVSPEKQQRVLAAVAELGYRPNAIARSLRARRTRILGLVLPDTANPYFAGLSHAIEEAAAARGYQVVVSNAADRPDREASQIEALLRLQVDGLLWIPADVRGARRPPWPPPIPTVQVDRALPHRGGPLACDVIGSDNVGGGRLAAAHLVQLGHRRVAYLAGPAYHLHARARLRGFEQALAEAGLALAPDLVDHGDFKYASGAAIAVRWCRLPAGARPTAIACGNDAMAIGALWAAAEAGLRVPHDVSITGYDDLPQAAYTVPPLSTVAQPLEQIGDAAVARLLARIESPAEAAKPASLTLPVRFVARRSTAPPPA
jgi:LacI family transcriptional regulator